MEAKVEVRMTHKRNGQLHTRTVCTNKRHSKAAIMDLLNNPNIQIKQIRTGIKYPLRSLSFAVLPGMICWTSMLKADSLSTDEIKEWITIHIRN